MNIDLSKMNKSATTRIGYMKMTPLQANRGNILCHAAKSLSPNGVSQFLSLRVTQIVSFGGFPRENGREESKLKSFNSLKNWNKWCFPWSLSANGTGIALPKDKTEYVN